MGRSVITGPVIDGPSGHYAGSPLFDDNNKTVSEHLSEIYKTAAVLNKQVEEAVDEHEQDDFWTYYLRRGKEMATVIQELTVSAHNSLIGKNDNETIGLFLDNDTNENHNEGGDAPLFIMIMLLLVTLAVAGLIIHIKRREDWIYDCVDTDDRSTTESEEAEIRDIEMAIANEEQASNGLEKVIELMQRARQELAAMRARTQQSDSVELAESVEHSEEKIRLIQEMWLKVYELHKKDKAGQATDASTPTTSQKGLENAEQAGGSAPDPSQGADGRSTSEKEERQNAVSNRPDDDMAMEPRTKTPGKQAATQGEVKLKQVRAEREKIRRKVERGLEIIGKKFGSTTADDQDSELEKAVVNHDLDDKEKRQGKDNYKEAGLDNAATEQVHNEDDGLVELMLAHSDDVVVKAGSRVRLCFHATATGYKTLDKTIRVAPCQQPPHIASAEYHTLGEAIRVVPCRQLPDPMLVKTESNVVRTRDVHFDSRNKLTVRIELFNLAPYDVVMDVSVCYYKLHLFHSTKTRSRGLEDSFPSGNDMEPILREKRRQSTIAAIGSFGPFTPSVPRSHPLWSLGNQQLLSGIPFPAGVIRKEKKKLSSLAIPLDFDGLAQQLLLYKSEEVELMEVPAEFKRINPYLLEVFTSDQDTDCKLMHANCTVCGQCKKWSFCWRKNCQLCNNALAIEMINTTGKVECGTWPVEMVRDVVYHQLVSRCALPAAENVRYPLHRTNVLQQWAHEQIGSNSYYNQCRYCLECQQNHLYQTRKSAAAYYLPHEMTYNLVYERDEEKKGETPPFMMMNHHDHTGTSPKEWSSLNCPRPVGVITPASGLTRVKNNPLILFHRLVKSTYQDIDDAANNE